MLKQKQDRDINGWVMMSGKVFQNPFQRDSFTLQYAVSTEDSAPINMGPGMIVSTLDWTLWTAETLS